MKEQRKGWQVEQILAVFGTRAALAHPRATACAKSIMTKSMAPWWLECQILFVPLLPGTLNHASSCHHRYSGKEETIPSATGESQE
jgi:hypothetical protein